MEMTDRSYSYRFSPRLMRFMGRTYAPSIATGYTYAPANGRVSNRTYAPSLTRDRDFSPSMRNFLSNTFAPSLKRDQNYAPWNQSYTSNRYSPYTSTRTDYSPKTKEYVDYSPFTDVDRREVYSPFEYYDFEKKTDYAPTNVDIRYPKIVIDSTPLDYLSAYNRYIIGLLKVL